jgi:hypothetical protein
MGFDFIVAAQTHTRVIYLQMAELKPKSLTSVLLENHLLYGGRYAVACRSPYFFVNPLTQTNHLGSVDKNNVFVATL